MVRLILSFLGFLGLRGAIKRPAAAERKLERALCPIHTMVRSKAVKRSHLCLTDFHAWPAPSVMGTGASPPPAEPYGASRGPITGRRCCRPFRGVRRAPGQHNGAKQSGQAVASVLDGFSRMARAERYGNRRGP